MNNGSIKPLHTHAPHFSERQKEAFQEAPCYVKGALIGATCGSAFGLPGAVIVAIGATIVCEIANEIGENMDSKRK